MTGNGFGASNTVVLCPNIFFWRLQNGTDLERRIRSERIRKKRQGIKLSDENLHERIGRSISKVCCRGDTRAAERGGGGCARECVTKRGPSCAGQ